MEILRGRSLLGSKRVIQRGLRKMGIEVRKFPSTSFRPISVFDLAVNLLMARKGDALSFVQVGANDGVCGDPLRPYITRHPWHGILVEPQPDVFARLVANYQPYSSRLIFENVAVSSGDSQFVLYTAPADLVKDPVHAASVASSNPQVLARQLNIPAARLERLVTASISLDALLARHGLSSLDVLQIDVEGHDWQVLRTLDLARMAPSIIQFEAGHLSHVDCDCAVEYLTRHDYEIYWGGYQADVLALRRALLLTTPGA
jgi:FkbM family methyltransferase